MGRGQHPARVPIRRYGNCHPRLLVRFDLGAVHAIGPEKAYLWQDLSNSAADAKQMPRPKRGAATPSEGRRSPSLPNPERLAEGRLVAFIPAHFPERFHWLTDGVLSAQSADRILVVASYAQPLKAARWRNVDWVHNPSLVSTGSKYREAVRQTNPGDIIGILDDDDLWLPEKVRTIRKVFLGPVDYFGHAAAIVRGGIPTGILSPQNANSTMTVVRRDLLTSARVKPFLDRLEWGCEPFLRYAPLAMEGRIELSNAVLAHVRYHDANFSHPPTGYRRFIEWQRAISERYLSAWKLIDEMTRHLENRPKEIAEKIAEFTRIYELSLVGRSATYLFSQQ